MRIAFLALFPFCLSMAACSSAPAKLKGPSPASSTPVAFASRAVALPLSCVDLESPHTFEGLGDAKHAVKKIHPAFYGCYDWHSAVHSHWAMLRLLNQNPQLPERRAIISELNRHLTQKNIGKEVAYLRKNPDYEFPYGGAWVLRLAQEIETSKLNEAIAWKKAIEPLTKFTAERFQEFLAASASPLRVGVHDNTAFALSLAWDYSQSAGDHRLSTLVKAKALSFYREDKNCGIEKEPGPHDFISPCLVEADLMRRLLEVADFQNWFNDFLPTIPPSFLKPTLPEDPENYSESHLIGLMFQKASAMRAIVMALPGEDPRKEQLRNAIEGHLENGWDLMFRSGYGGSHWLATFAIYYFTDAGL